MKVALFTLAYPPTPGGVATYVQTLAMGLAAAGDEVRVYVRGEAKENVSVKREEDRGTVTVCTVSSFSKQVIKGCRWADVNHMNGFWLAAALSTGVVGKPLIWTHHEYDTICPIGLGWYNGRSTAFSPGRCTRCMRSRGLAVHIPRRFALLPVRRLVAQWARVNLAPTSYVADRLALPRSVVIHHGSEASVAAEGPTLDRPCFAFIGRLVPEKGCEILLDAARICLAREVRFSLEIIGEGPELPALRYQARVLGLNEITTFTGSLPQSEVRRRMRRFRAVVVPSVWDEPAGLVALEAMAGGVPVIAARVGGLAEIVEGAGILIERGSSNELADAMTYLARDERAARRFEEAGRARHRTEYRAERMIAEHQALYEIVASR